MKKFRSLGFCECLKKKIWTNPRDRHFTLCAILQKRERERRRHNEEEDIHIYKNNTNNNGTNAGEVKRSDLRHFLEQSRNHGLLRPRRLERDLEENRRRMVRRDRVRDRTDRGDRDVSVIVFSHLSFVRSSFVVVSEKDGVLVSLSLVLFLNAEQMRRRGTQRRERERRKNPPRDHRLTLLSLITKQVRAELQRTRETPPQILIHRD